jgi:dCMP deaminase
MNRTERARPSWDEYGMLLALAASERSPDPFVAVGAAAFRKDHSTVSTGYNGAPSGQEIDWSDRDARRPFVVHAEENCLKYSKPGEPYYLYVTLAPCEKCFKKALEYGVKEIIYSDIYRSDTYALDNAEKEGVIIRQLKKRNSLERQSSPSSIPFLSSLLYRLTR